MFLRIGDEGELTQKVKRFCVQSGSRDSIRKLCHYLKMEASSDEIAEQIERIRVEPVAGGDATR